MLWGLALAYLLIAVAVAFFNPRVVSFRALNIADFVQSMLPLVMVALFIERVLEVFLTSWRARRKAELREQGE